MSATCQHAQNILSFFCCTHLTKTQLWVGFTNEQCWRIVLQTNATVSPWCPTHCCSFLVHFFPFSRTTISNHFCCLCTYLHSQHPPPPHFWNLPHHLVLKDVRAKPLGENFKPSATQMTHMPMSMPIPSSACDMDASFPPQEPRCTNDLGQLLLHHCIFTSPPLLILPHYPN